MRLGMRFRTPRGAASRHLPRDFGKESRGGPTRAGSAPSRTHEPLMAIVAVIIACLLVGALGLIGLLGAVRGTPIRTVIPLGSTLPPVDDPAFRTSMELVSR